MDYLPDCNDPELAPVVFAMLDIAEAGKELSDDLAAATVDGIPDETVRLRVLVGIDQLVARLDAVDEQAREIVTNMAPGNPSAWALAQGIGFMRANFLAAKRSDYHGEN